MRSGITKLKNLDKDIWTILYTYSNNIYFFAEVYVVNFGCNSTIKKLNNEITKWKLYELFMVTDSVNLDAQGYIVFEIRNLKNLSVVFGTDAPSVMDLFCVTYCTKKHHHNCSTASLKASVFENKSSEMVYSHAFLRLFCGNFHMRSSSCECCKLSPNRVLYSNLSFPFISLIN